MISRLRRFVEIQRDLGASDPVILGRLPADGFRYLHRLRNEGHQIDGYGRYDLPLLASYSRSGTNWIRYIVEWISERPTPGQVRIHSGSHFVLDRAHRAFVNMSKYDRVLLVVRDYRECLLRHNAKQWSEIGSVEAFLDAEGSFQWPGWYIENIRSFHSHEGPKHLLYYEDLIDEPENSIREISEFLGLSERRTDSFLSDLDRRYARSVDAYTSTGHQALTAGRPRGGHQHHAMLHLDARQMAEFDAYYRDREPDLFETYLARYEVAE